MKKILFIFSLILMCCGCTSEYMINIDENLKVKESIIALEDEEFYNQYDKSSVQRVIGFMLNPKLDYLNKNGFKISEILNSDTAGVKITNEYDSLKQYKEISQFPAQYGSNLEYIENGDEITLKIIGEFSAAEQDQSGKYLIDNGKITIKLPHNVINHNADEIDEKNGIYTWIIETAGEEREIFIAFNKNIKKDYTFLYLVIGGIIVVAVGTYYFISKTIYSNKKRNEL